MDLGWLEDFVTLAERGHFGRAAEARNLTQPAFSRRIRALEDWVGTPLFDRAVQPVALTPAGAALMPPAREALRLLSRGRGQAREAAGQEAGTLRFAVTHGLSLHVFPAWLRSLPAAVQPRAMHLSTDTLRGTIAALVGGETDFLICHQHPDLPAALVPAPEAFISCHIGRERLIPLCAAAATGAPRHVLSVQAMPPIMGYGPDSAFASAIAAVLRRNGAVARPHVVVQSGVALAHLVEQGDGVCWLPESLARADEVARRLVPADGEGGSWQAELDICLHRPKARLSRRAEAFWAAAEARQAGVGGI